MSLLTHSCMCTNEYITATLGRSQPKRAPPAGGSAVVFVVVDGNTVMICAASYQ